jgi:hypothetical protein
VAAGGEPEPLLLLSPLLLLLSQDPLLLRHLSERQRYLPPVLAMSGYLAASSAVQITSWSLATGEWSVLLLNGAMLALALPLHVLFAKYLWDRSPQPGMVLAGLVPGALLALLLGQSEAIRFLAGAAVVMAGLQYFAMRHERRVGMKVV